MTTLNLAARRIGGSDAAVIMNGQFYSRTIHDLWLEKTGQQQPADLTWELRVQMGVATESLNRRWYEHETGNKVVLHDQMTHPQHEWMTANFDGVTLGNIVVEFKHVGAFNKTPPAETYTPQCQHYMAVGGFAMAHLSVFHGTDKWALYEIPRDDAYIATLIEREAAFWFCVETNTAPPGWVPVDAPVAAPTKVVDMAGSNEWAAHAGDWASNAEAAKRYEKAAKALRGMVPADAKAAYGYGVTATRDGRGVTIKETKEKN